MKLSDFDYNLPEEKIALKPLQARDASKLLFLPKEGEVKDNIFRDIISFFEEGDALVFNDTKVIPARLYGEVNGKKAEMTLIKNISDDTHKEKWQVFVKPLKLMKKHNIFAIEGSRITAKLVSYEDNIAEVEFSLIGHDFQKFLIDYGKMPLPPYISKLRKENDSDQDSYQTVFASKEGAVAAPTAGLHFTKELLASLQAKGVQTINITLHVGAGTFSPVRVENIENHEMHSEYYEVSEDAAKKLNMTKEAGKKIFAVGTTSLRTLESSIDENGKVKSDNKETNIFIYPGYRFKVVDYLITNFHLPKSTLLMLVSAFSGFSRIKSAYSHAIKNDYRFFSYGDAMLLEKNDEF